MSARMADRRHDLARIHILAKDCRLARDEYEDLLFGLCRTRSSRDLDFSARQRVIAHLEKLARAMKRGAYPSRPRVAPDRALQVRKIEALLADAGRPWEYLTHASEGRESMVKRICKVERLEFCDAQMLGKLIAALTYDARRREAKVRSTTPEDGART